MNTYLSTRQASEYTGHHPNHIRNMATLFQATKGRRGLRGFQRVAPQGPWKFLQADLDAFMQS